MADYVETVMHDMVPELDDLRRKRIFDDEELRQIVKRRREFEYLLQKTPSKQQDYLSYVRYEVALECLRSKRSKALHWRKKTISDFAGIRRLHGIFNRGCRRFKGDKRMWYQYVDFCLRSGSTVVLSRVLLRALKFHPREVHLWLLAADRELKLGHMKAARALLVRALRFAPKSPKLWGEFFRLEVRIAARLIAVRASPEGAAEASQAKATESPWAPARVLLRRALGRLDGSPRACAAFLERALSCAEEAKADPAAAAAGVEDLEREVRAAIAERRPGVAEGREWADAPEDAAATLWRLWWRHEVGAGGWSAVTEAAAASAPHSVLQELAAAMAKATASTKASDSSDPQAAAEALARLAEAPRASGSPAVALAILEAMDACLSSAGAEVGPTVRSELREASRSLADRAASAHPGSARLGLLSWAAAAPGGDASAPWAGRREPRGPAALVLEAECLTAEEAVSLLLLAADETSSASAPASAGAGGGSGRRTLEALLRRLAAHAPAAPLVSAFLSRALALGGAASLEASAAEVRDVAERLWDLPARRADVLAAALSAELRAGCCGEAVQSARRVVSCFEDLLAALSDSSPEKEEWWLRYIDFAQRATRWGCTVGKGGVPSATDLHWRAMRSVADQARYAERAQRHLQEQGV